MMTPVLLAEYIQVAMAKAEYEIVEDDGAFFGHIPPLEGVWRHRERLDQCRAELAEVLEEWLLLRLSQNLPIPDIDGISLKVEREVA